MATRARSRYEIAADDKTERALKNINKNIRSVHDSFVSLRTIVVGVAGAAGLGALIDRSLEAADAIGKQADAIGLTTDQYQELVFVADKAAISQQQFNSNMTAFVKRVGEARAGVGPLTSFMRKYDEEVFRNIVNSRSQEQALNVVSEAIRNATDAAERAAIANAAFGRSGIAMVNMLDDGIDAMEEWRQRARDLGLVMDESLIRNAEAAGDRLSTLSDILRLRVTAAVVELAPEIEALSQLFIDTLKSSTEFFKAMDLIETPADKLRDEIQSLAEQRDALVAMRRQRLDTAIPDFVQRMMGLETPEELLVKLNEINEIVLEKQKELQEILRQPEAPEANIGIVTPGAQENGGGDQEEKQRESLQRQLDIINQGFLSEEELALQHFERQALIIEQAFADKIIPTEEAFRAKRAENEAQFQDKLTSIEKKGLTGRQKFLRMSLTEQVDAVAGSLSQATAAVAQENEVMFRLNQAAGIANVIVTTIQGINRAFMDFPYPIALGISAAVAAAGAVNVAAIASQSIGGGSVAPSDAARGAVSGPVPTLEATSIGAPEEAQTVQQVSITLNGTGYSKQDVRDLIESINEEIGDGLVLETT